MFLNKRRNGSLSNGTRRSKFEYFTESSLLNFPNNLLNVEGTLIRLMRRDSQVILFIKTLFLTEQREDPWSLGVR